MADWRTFFGLDQGCKDRCGNDVGPAPENACDSFGVDANSSEKEPGAIQLLCEDLTKGFHCKTINFLGKLNAWTKGFLCWLSNHESRITSIENGGNSLNVGTDNQIPYVNGTNDDFEYDNELTYDHTQDELNVEHITTNLSVATSEHFGAGADASFQNSVAVGSEAIAAADASVAIGRQAVANSQGVAVGYFADTGTGDNNVVVGQSAESTSIRGVAIGADSLVTGTGGTAVGGSGAEAAINAVAIGNNSEAGGQAVAVGQSADTAVGSAVAVGWRAKSLIMWGIALGRDAVAGVLAAREFVAQNVTHSYFGLYGVERPTSVPNNDGNFYLRTTGGTGTDAVGDHLHIQAGSSSGAGEGGKIYLGTSQPGASGTARRDQVDMWSVNPDGNLESLIDGSGIVLKSPDGLTTRTLTIDNAGALVVS